MAQEPLRIKKIAFLYSFCLLLLHNVASDFQKLFPSASSASQSFTMEFERQAKKSGQTISRMIISPLLQARTTLTLHFKSLHSKQFLKCFYLALD